MPWLVSDLTIKYTELYGIAGLCKDLPQRCPLSLRSVHMEHVTPINEPLVLLINCYSGYEGAGKAISVSKQALAM